MNYSLCNYRIIEWRSPCENYNYYCIKGKFLSIKKLSDDGRYEVWKRNDEIDGYVLQGSYTLEEIERILEEINA